MFWLVLPFLISQILVGIAIITDFISFQFKDRKYVLWVLTISALLIASHYLLLWKYNAAILVSLWACSFLISSFSHNKKWLYFFAIIYAIPLIFNYKEIYDLVVWAALYVMLVWKFQENDKAVRVYIMIWATLAITYNVLIFTPVGVLLECIFLGSNLLGYWKHYIKKKTAN